MSASNSPWQQIPSILSRVLTSSVLPERAGVRGEDRDPGQAHHHELNVDFTVNLGKTHARMYGQVELEKMFKLSSTLALTNMVLFNADGKLQRYASPVHVIREFFPIRMKLYHERKAYIHVSGHGYRDDMKHLINLTNPRYFTPVHGEFRHLKDHCGLAREQGLLDDEIHLVENGQVLEVTQEGCSFLGKIPHGRVIVDSRQTHAYQRSRSAARAERGWPDLLFSFCGSRFH